jgi:shikimate kinase
VRTPILLIGPMGVGKTTVGKKLAKALSVGFIDTDKEVVRSHGQIPRIFSEHGEKYFRELESEALKRSLNSAGVIATGGGIVLSPENQVILSQNFVVYLSTNGMHMRSRLLARPRPLLRNGMDDWRRIYEERRAQYEKLSTVQIDTSGKSLGSVVDEIMAVVSPG